MKSRAGGRGAWRDGVEVGGRTAPLSPSLSGPRRCQAGAPDCCVRPWDSTWSKFFFAVSAYRPAPKARLSDGGCSTPSAAGLDVDGGLLATGLQPPRGAGRAVPGERAACEDGAGPQDGCARQRVARPAARTRPAPPGASCRRRRSANCATGCYRKRFIEERAREANRVQKVLETANIKLGSVVTTVLGVSARAMLKALIAGAGAPGGAGGAGPAEPAPQARGPRRGAHRPRHRRSPLSARPAPGRHRVPRRDDRDLRSPYRDAHRGRGRGGRAPRPFPRRPSDRRDDRRRARLRHDSLSHRRPCGVLGGTLPGQPREAPGSA